MRRRKITSETKLQSDKTYVRRDGIEIQLKQNHHDSSWSWYSTRGQDYNDRGMALTGDRDYDIVYEYIGEEEMITAPPTNFTSILRHAGTVRRYHTWAVHHYQTVGEHSWQIARIYVELWGPIPFGVETHIRLHDVAELKVGDPPFPVKMNNPELKAQYDALEVIALSDLNVELPPISADNHARVKVCDLLEMTEFGMAEREFGNMNAVPIVIRTERTARDYALLKLGQEAHDKVVSYVNKLWDNHETVLRAGNVAHEYNKKCRMRQNVSNER